MIDVEPLDEIDSYVGRRISDIREASALTEEGLASLLGLDVRGLRAIEAGKVKVFAETLLTASRVLSVPVSALLPPDLH
ncbi:helix-turn-helix transcriptional regulator [Brevundimonas pondensis]|uniref:Helix-turn-helix transcriptional regulator n=1 Tax=Brevundimonas pondensis TaxID=2774189 RepID=A0ABX7SHA3_9CAUL|nr:helix-turn-helix transcriptional regulator [Brevundimonas pondensis]QTC86378.1 helix-turn-helix transcriptional regulator [Brevundimonas pondensis]